MAHKLDNAMSGFANPSNKAENVAREKPTLRFAHQFRVGRSGTIIIADADDEAASLLSYALKGASVRNPIRRLEDSEAVIRFLSHGETKYSNVIDDIPLLLLLDWNMPQTGAIDVLKWIRQQPGYLDLLVIVITESNDPEQKRLAYEAGANWHFVKSADFTDLMRLVRHIREFWSYAVEPSFYEQLAAR